MKAPTKPWNFGLPESDWKWEDGSFWYEREDPAKGLSFWLALYHHINRAAAREVYALALTGYDDENLLDPDWPEEEIADFQKRFGRFHILMMQLREDLFRKLRHGDLVAYGYTNTAPLDAPRQKIGRDRWRDLDMDLKASTATGFGLTITQILVFAGDQDTNARRPTLPGKHSAAALRSWYLARVTELVDKGERSSRERDHADANQVFGGQISRRAVEDLRRSLAPAQWRRHGRPSGRRVGDTSE